MRFTGWLKKSKLLTQYNSLLIWATLYMRRRNHRNSTKAPRNSECRLCSSTHQMWNKQLFSDRL